MQRLIQHHIEASKIGRQIAEQATDTTRQEDETPAVENMSCGTESTVQVETNDVSFISRRLELTVGNNYHFSHSYIQASQLSNNRLTQPCASFLKQRTNLPNTPSLCKVTYRSLT